MSICENNTCPLRSMRSSLDTPYWREGSRPVMTHGDTRYILQSSYLLVAAELRVRGRVAAVVGGVVNLFQETSCMWEM
jgi:hypothetical protein